MTAFAELAGSIYRVLRSENEGVWLISYDSPAAPFYMAGENLWKLKCIPAPEEYLEKTEQKLSKAQKRRLELIQPLLNNPDCISDKGLRSAIAESVADENRTTVRRVLRLYYRYLATGQLTAKKERPEQKSKVYDWAIRTFYFRAKKFSLRATYDMMLVQRFTDGQGNLMEEAPTWSSFRHYFYSKKYHKEPRKVISREGLTHYQRNCRPAFGSASGWRSQVGSYQMDATQADICIDEILIAVNGTLSEHQRGFLRMIFGHLEDLEAHKHVVEDEIAVEILRHSAALELMCSIPGIDVTAAAALLAEIGTDMSVFPDAQHICSWAGLSPGNNESAGKRKSAHINKGNPYVKGMLCEVAWIVSSHRKLYLSGWYWRVKQRKGAKRATIALARKLLSLIYTMLKTGTSYNEECFEQRQKNCERKRASRMINELQKLGYQVVQPG